ncbi:hypothetical protein CVD25_20230 [Bacillus canaveralius]|uniref:Glycosyltransferase RgtA/B/C/D-like domain-containing protein n=1 Tax=Bacillus canaveralius TaxID=1403243 RepID=A0A2N5GFR0_9BACI|nr:hypothetical protein [Bacillus canaveralius]PLR79599.1 hypothetical protein CU635_22305 [Bacillus canaveralius]PLR90095.1 hypothetical protein CVD25_20230 [Bacillus canaveralius]RSK52500.1 hypothetical protein EJA13_11200 [Bacillus canaveralius]
MQKIRDLAGRNFLSPAILYFFSLASITTVIVVQLIYVNPFASTWDQVDFTLGLQRYDIMAMQPHFPGYPYFILGGKFIHLFIENPSQALTIFNILCYVSALYPIYRLTRVYLASEFSALMTAVLYTASFCIVMVNQPISEGAALAFLWWYLWSLEISLIKERRWFMIVPLFLLSIILGIRLSYLPFSIGVIYLFYIKWKTNRLSLKEVFGLSAVAIVFQLVWVIAIIVSEGGMSGFLKLSLGFTSGHFQSWGGAVAPGSESVAARAGQLVFDNFFWTGISAQSVVLGCLYGLLILLFLYGFRLKFFLQSQFLHMPALLFGFYFIWALLAQNIDKPRHILPLTVLFLFVILVFMLSRRKNPLITAILVMILAVQVVQSARLVKEQATNEPAVVQMANYLKQSNQKIVVYTWEETRVFKYLDASFPHKRIETFQVFQHDSAFYSDRNILLTDKVVKGFHAQEINLDGMLEKVAEFHSNELFDPVYSDITLYKWKSNKGGGQNE